MNNIFAKKESKQVNSLFGSGSSGGALNFGKPKSNPFANGWGSTFTTASASKGTKLVRQLNR